MSILSLLLAIVLIVFAIKVLGFTLWTLFWVLAIICLAVWLYNQLDGRN